jgi:cbb3-type cytochrome oxidase subunit 1
MPRLSYLFIRASLVYLVLGFTLGGLILANKSIPFAPYIWALLPAHIEFLILGWLTQLALGVAFWILPRLASSTPRGNERWSWMAFALVNLGIALNIAAPYLGLTWLGLLARILQAAGVAAFAIGNWQRIYPLKFSFQARQ